MAGFGVVVVFLVGPKCSKIQFFANMEGEAGSDEIRLLDSPSDMGLQPSVMARATSTVKPTKRLLYVIRLVVMVVEEMMVEVVVEEMMV